MSHPSTSEVAQRRRLLEAWGEYLRTFAWSHVATLTTAEMMSPAHLLILFEQRFLRRLAHKTERGVPYFSVVERSGSGLYHLHALLAGTDTISVRAIERAWHWGMTRVTRYDPRLGATFYLAEKIAGELVEHRISRRPPPRIAVSKLRDASRAAQSGANTQEG